jgi:acyl carrier protein
VRALHSPTRTRYPVSLAVTGAEGLTLSLTYDSRYLSVHDADEVLRRLQRLLDGMCNVTVATVRELLALLPPPPLGARRHDDDAVLSTATMISPRTATEAVLARIWGTLLGVERIGVTDNFFALGGHSLVAMQIATRISETFRITIPIRVLFKGPTVAEVAVALTGREAAPGDVERTAQLVQQLDGMSIDELRRAASAPRRTRHRQPRTVPADGE